MKTGMRENDRATLLCISENGTNNIVDNNRLKKLPSSCLLCLVITVACLVTAPTFLHFRHRTIVHAFLYLYMPRRCQI